MRRALVPILSVSLLACGSGTTTEGPPKTPVSEGGETASTKSETPEAPAPKPASKYPEPFLEPDCANPQPEGHLANAKHAVAEVRKKNWDKLMACAEAAPPGENISGEIRTTFRLDPDGVPRCVEAPGSSMANKDVVNCVVQVYRTFRFPKPKGGSIRVTDGIHLDVSHGDEDE